MSQVVYVPVTDETLSNLLKADSTFGAFLEPLCLDELLGLFALQRLPDFLAEPLPLVEFEKLLALSFEAVRGLPEKSTSSLKQDIVRNLDFVKLTTGVKAMHMLGVRLVNPEVIETRAYLTGPGEWDYEFNQRYGSRLFASDHLLENSPYRLSEEQTRVAGIVISEMDEHLHLQGYAGTGKTYLIRGLLDLLQSRGIPPEQVLIIALSFSQLKNLMTKIPKGYQGMTFGALAAQVIPRDYLRLKRSPEHQYQISEQEIARHYNFGTIAGAGDLETARFVTATLRNYCYSADDRVGTNHLPKELQSRIQGGRKENELLKELVVKTAEDMWRKTTDSKSRDLRPPIRGYHQIKLVAQQGWTIPRNFSHVIIDEAHDLSPAMLQFLDASPQCCISLGDDYQNLNGAAHHRSHLVREKQISQSYRAGTQLNQLVNPIINKHPFGPKDNFRGHSDIHTLVEYYTQAEVPDSPAAILVGSDWSLWEWVQRVANKGQRYDLISSLPALDNFVEGTVKLKTYGIRPNHPLLHKFTKWDDLAKHYKNDSGFVKINEMLDRHYALSDWEATKQLYSPQGKNVYVLGKADQSRNHEFDRLMLTPDVIGVVTGTGGQVAKKMSVLYVAITRVKHILIAPASLRDWIEEISARTNFL